MAVPGAAVSLTSVSLLALGVATLLSLFVLVRLEGDGLIAPLRHRFVLGVPWGSLAVLGVVLSVYLFVQGAWGSLTNPVVVAFRAWSFTYPLGMLTASFAHDGLGHLTGNLVFAVVFAPLAEYVWGHYLTDRGSQTFTSLQTNPFARAGLFAAGVLAIGLVGALFVPGPVVGFSGVVFALAGFVLVTRPVAGVVAVVGVQVVRTGLYALVEPVAVARAHQEYVQPWFADVAVQGHLFGLLVGVLAGAALLARRRESVRARHVWFATLAFAVAQTLYALYWYLGTDTYQLFRAAGLAAVLVLVAAVAGAVAGSDGRPIPRSDLTWRHLAAGVLATLLVAMALAAVPHNLADVEPVDREGTVEVEDYTVFYAEDVEHGYATAVPLPGPLASASANARASGVVVVSDRRNAWEERVSAGELAVDNRATVALGGLGWRERVVATRTVWDAVDAGTTYTVHLQRPGGSRTLAYTDDPVSLAPTIAGRNLTIEPTDGGYRLNVTRNGSSVVRVPVPADGETVRIDDLVVERDGEDLSVAHEGTTIRVARYRSPG